MRILVVLWLWMVPVLAMADAFCFATAETYYEQVYCEVQARGAGASLPPVHEFRNNPEMTQALLLRPPTRQLGIALVMPDRSPPGPAPVKPAVPEKEPSAKKEPSAQKGPSAKKEPSAQKEPSAKKEPLAQREPSVPGELSIFSAAECRQQARSLICGDSRYAFAGNRPNADLGDQALAPANRLSLPAFEGTDDDRAALNSYLARSYRRYIHKMRGIGLAGATMTYGRFVLLFEDMLGRGIDASERAETMFSHLKRDKANLAVRESAAPPTLDTDHCLALDNALVVCSAGRRNYVFERQ